jgi:hypothetical protein
MPLYLAVERGAVAILSGQLDLTRVFIDVGHAIAHLVDGCVELPAKSHVESQVAIHAPVVLEKHTDRAVSLAHGSRESLAVGHIRRKPEQKIGFRVAGVLSIESDLARRAVAADGWNIVVAVAFELHAGRHRVRSMDEKLMVSSTWITVWWKMVPAHVGRGAVGARVGTEIPRPVVGVEEIVAQKFESLPWIWLVADLRLTLMTPPRKWPNSALGLLVRTLNSWIASTLGEKATLLSTNSLLSNPSRR